MPRISVIVPVYQVELYLSQCIESILKQTFTDFELILIDDGSTDKSGKICDEYAENDVRIHVIHQKNQGLSCARNAGINVAKGKYITFIDSDDMIACDYLKRLLDTIRKHNADISVCQAVDFINEKNLVNHNKTEEIEEVLDSETACIRIYNGDKSISVIACGKLFKIELFKELRFPEGRLHEDQAIIPLVFYKAEQIVVINCNLYYYRVRMESITRRRFSIKRYDDLWAIEKCIDFFKIHNEHQILEAALKNRELLIAVYAIYAKRDCVKVPYKYKIRIRSALRYLHNNVSNEKYEYYLAQVYPQLVIVYEYKKKLIRLLRLKGKESNSLIHYDDSK